MAVRDPKTGRFVKGQSGNPGGRPKGIYTLIDEAVTDADWQELINRLKKLAMRGNLKAMEMLLDRRWGKPTQSIEAGEKTGLKISVSLSGKSD